MNVRSFDRSVVRRKLMAMALVAAILMMGMAVGSRTAAAADSSAAAAAVRQADGATGLPRLVGSWNVTITPDDGAEPFVGFYTFHADGTASFASAGPPIPGLGNPGFGVWKQLGSGDFATTIQMISYTADFQFDGTLKILTRIHFTSNNSFTTEDTVKVYAPDGSEIVTLGGGSAGTRMVVELAH